MLDRAYDDLEERIETLRAAEELAAIRPDLDGGQIMAELGVAPGPIVGEAYRFLMDLRMEKGPVGEELARQAQVVRIDPQYSDTDALNAHYALAPEATGNCVLVAGKRTGQERIAACVVRATDFADVNHVVKKRIDVRKASFLPVERAVEMSGMEYGGITPVGLPEDWRLFIDGAVADRDTVLIGSGVRHSKLLVPGALLVALPGAERVENVGVRPC